MQYLELYEINAYHKLWHKRSLETVGAYIEEYT